MCVLFAIAIDQFILEALVNILSPEWLPLGFFQVILLPIILLIGAKLVGPSDKIRVSRPGGSSSRDKRK